MATSQKVEEILNRINTHQGVLGVVIVNKKGVAIKSTMKPEDNILYGALVTQFADKVEQTIKALHKEEEVYFVKVRSNMYEIMIAPDKEFNMIVLQDDPANMGRNDGRD